jgi:hypothetical protein
MTRNSLKSGDEGVFALFLTDDTLEDRASEWRGRSSCNMRCHVLCPSILGPAHILAQTGRQPFQILAGTSMEPLLPEMKRTPITRAILLRLQF